MNKDQWQQIEKIFYAAMELPRDERDDFISQACAGDEELQGKVQHLLAANQDAESFLDSPVNMPPHSGTFSPTLVMPHPEAKTGATVESGVRIGAYRLIREIGRGGMGAVWLAERADGQFYQQVAIKLLHAGSENEEVIRRFRHERQILASLDHPNIARLLDGGSTEDGRPYFVMEHIEGLPVDEYCRQHQLSVDDRLKLFRQVCAAVHYAHQHLVIHRDLKPSNIAVTADVYSLGVVLYELLTGRSPYRLKAHGFGELMRAVIEQEPERPSTAITRSDGAPPTNPITIEPTEKLRRRLSGDIDSIVLMALRKEPPSRYGSVEQFSEDLRRYLEGLPTAARRGTFGYRALKYIRRNKAPVAATVLILLSLFGGIASTLRQARIAKSAQLRAEAEKSEALSQRNLAKTALMTADERRQQAEAARIEADQQRDEAEAQRNFAEDQQARAESQELTNRHLLYASQMKLAQTAWDESNIERVGELLTAHIPKSGQQDLRGFEWNWLWKISHTELADLPHLAAVTSVAFSPDGANLVTIEKDSEIITRDYETLRVWQISTGKEKYRIRGKIPGDIGPWAAFSSDGKFFGTGGYSCGISIWETGTGKRLRKIAESVCDLWDFALAPDGKKLATIRWTGKISIFDSHSGQELFNIQTPFTKARGTTSLTFSPTGQALAVASSEEKSIKLWDTDSGKELLSLSREIRGRKPLFSPDGRYFVTGLLNPDVLIVDAITGKEIATIKPDDKSTGWPRSLALSPTGKELAIATNGQVSFWETTNWQQIGNIRGFGAPINTIAFAPDGLQLASGTSDGKVKLWDLKQNQEPTVYKIDKGFVDKLAFSQGGRRLFVFGSDLVTRAFDTSMNRELFSLKGHFLEKPVMNPVTLFHGMAMSNDGKRVATTADENIRIWDTSTGRQLRLIQTPGWNNFSLAISQDGRMVATRACPCAQPKKNPQDDPPNLLRVWDTATGHEVFSYTGEKAEDTEINRIVFLKDNRTIVTGSIRGNGELTWWDLTLGKSIRTLNVMKRGIHGLSLSPDGKWLAVGDGNGTVSIFDVRTGLTTITLKGHRVAVREISFSPDGNRLLTGSSDRTIKLWDLTTGQELMVFRDASQSGGSAFSPDGRSIAVAYPLGVLKVFTAEGPKNIRMAGR